MPFIEQRSIRYYTHPIMSEAAVNHAIFTRRGGVSPKPWDSLNVGSGQDDPKRVSENRNLAFQSIRRDPRSIYDVWQVHSKVIVCTRTPRTPESQHLRADGILTDNPSVTLFMRFADCVPISLFDPNKRVVGIIHAGWQGTIKGIAMAAIEKMEKIYHTRPDDVLAAIGPSIGPDHYEIGEDVAALVKKTFIDDVDRVLVLDRDRYCFDLWKANRIMLEQAGVNQIEVAGICTACHTEDWFSHRAELGQTGRFGASIALDGSAS